MGTIIAQRNFRKLFLSALFLSLDVSLLLACAHVALIDAAIPPGVFIAFAAVFVLALPFLVRQFAHAYRQCFLKHAGESPTFATQLKRLSFGVLYALALLLAFLAVCGAIGLFSSLLIVPAYGIVSARTVVMFAVQVLAVLAIPIPSMLFARYALFQKRESPVVALSSFRGVTWFYLTIGSAICFLLGWGLALVLSSFADGLALIAIQVLISCVIGTTWLIYCAVICASCAGSDCEINPECKLNIPRIQRKANKAAQGTVACLLSFVLAFGIKVENGQIYYAGNTEYRFDKLLADAFRNGELGVYIVRMNNEVPPA